LTAKLLKGPPQIAISDSMQIAEESIGRTLSHLR
jgi:hypothetical protein